VTVFSYEYPGNFEAQLLGRAQNIKSHVSRHLQQMALSVLPRLCDISDLDSRENVMGSKGGESSQSGFENDDRSSIESSSHSSSPVQTPGDGLEFLDTELDTENEVSTDMTMNWHELGITSIGPPIPSDPILAHISQAQARKDLESLVTTQSETGEIVGSNSFKSGVDPKSSPDLDLALILMHEYKKASAEYLKAVEETQTKMWNVLKGRHFLFITLSSKCILSSSTNFYMQLFTLLASGLSLELLQ
jgi:hypothetical protein